MKNIDLGKTSTTKIFLVYVIPSIFSIIFSTTAQFVDSAFIGHFVGENGLASITMLSPFLMLLNGVSIMIAIGGVTYAGISRGNEDYPRSNYFFNLTLKLIIVTAVVSTLLSLLVVANLQHIFDVSIETLTMMKQYGFWFSLFLVFGMMNLTFNLFLNLDRKPVQAVIVSSISTGLNVILNFLLIYVLNMGIRGAAIASGVSQLIPTIIYIYLIINKSTWNLNRVKFVIQDIKRILFNGSSELVNISSVAITGFILNRVILSNVGIEGVAAFSIAMQLGGLVTSFGFGVSDAIQSPVSFNYGAKQYGRVKSILRKGIILNVVVGIILLISSMLYGDVFASLLINNQSTIDMAFEILKLYSISFAFMGANVVISTYYTSVDSPALSALISVLKSMIYVFIWLAILPRIMGNNGIWLAMVYAEISTSITAIIIYRKYPYRKHETPTMNHSTNIVKECL